MEEEYQAWVKLPNLNWTGIVKAQTRQKAAIKAAHKFLAETKSQLPIGMLASIVSLKKVPKPKFDLSIMGEK